MFVFDLFILLDYINSFKTVNSINY
jgi:hypothetical protein